MKTLYARVLTVLILSLSGVSWADSPSPEKPTEPTYEEAHKAAAEFVADDNKRIAEEGRVAAEKYLAERKSIDKFNADHQPMRYEQVRGYCEGMLDCPMDAQCVEVGAPMRRCFCPKVGGCGGDK